MLPRLPRLALLLLLAGCVTPDLPPQGYATLPNDAVQGAGDPTRAAIIGTAYAFGNPASLAGNPAAAARAVANYEYLATELPYGPRWRGFAGTIGPEFAAGLTELRGTLGIAPNAPAQPVVEALYAASRAFNAGDQAAAERSLSGPIFTRGGPATLQRLASLPAMPRVAAATAHAAQELDRQDRLGSPRGVGGGGGGGGGRP
ncbi:hypothetical protein JMJ55_09095 [Belnapia sp. T6]|uniref:Uncharacterized protein n=1 Tax=Belnapia mucosa TaxID=2804532 RepID=A0ABS1V198_9PROT|nr:hypothetical protein [Belnapia mucosa]MBL6455477.1 hypothetical protein [Belnapia mucosa]